MVSRALIAGDLVFVRLLGSEFDLAVDSCHPVPTSYNHVYIVETEYSWIEASPLKGVTRSKPLAVEDDIMLRQLCSNIAAKRFSSFDNVEKKKFVASAVSLLGKPYNAGFKNSSESYYCSQLVIDCARRVCPTFLAHALHPMTFRKNGTIVDYWRRYFEQLGLDIPEGELGSHPATLSLAHELTQIWECRF